MPPLASLIEIKNEYQGMCFAQQTLGVSSPEAFENGVGLRHQGFH